jgi:predicted O-methyltransferase YrrM
MNNQVFEQVDDYISNLLATEDTTLTNTLLALGDIPNMSISPTQGKLLQVFSAACNAKNILELGTFAGYSTIWLARSLQHGGKVITLESDETHAGIARKNIEHAGFSSVVDIRVGNAMDTLTQLQNELTEPFDLVFIDADKPPYTEYFQMALKMSRPGTIIIADNVVRNGKVLDENTTDEKVQGVQRFNKMLADCPGITATILQTVGVKEYDGMAIAVVNY